LRYEATTGLDDTQIQGLVARIHQILPAGGRGRRPMVVLYRQVMLTLVLVRSNITQTLLADLAGISQPTVSRIYRTTLPLIEQVTCLHQPPSPTCSRTG
jgi:hypothetical protein